MDFLQARDLLSRPGQPFEIASESWRGFSARMYVERPRCVMELVQRASASFGDATFLIDGERRISYREFERLVAGTAYELSSQEGVGKGDRVAILGFNSPEWLIAAFAIAALGGIAVGLNAWWHPREVADAMREAGCCLLIADARLYELSHAAVAALPGLRRALVFGRAQARDSHGARDFTALMLARDEPPRAEVNEDDPFILLYTSGTTGRPSACALTHRGTIAQAQSIAHDLTSSALAVGARAPKDSATPRVSLLTSPLFHVSGLQCGACVALVVPTSLVFAPPRFDAEALMQLIEAHRVSFWGAVPTLVQRLLDHPSLPQHDLSSLMVVSTGGAPTAPRLLNRLPEALCHGVIAGTTYGLTETHGLACSIAAAELRSRPSSVGRAIALLDLEVADGDGVPLPRGQIGEIRVRGVTVTPGYWSERATSVSRAADGWLATGDLGRIDDEGYLYICDRRKDVVVRGGEKIHCIEVENCLCGHPAVEEAAVIGVPDSDMGERAKAIVRLRPNMIAAASEIQQYVGEHLARFKIPEFVEFCDAPLPRNAGGKLLKHELRRAAVADDCGAPAGPKGVA